MKIRFKFTVYILYAFGSMISITTFYSLGYSEIQVIAVTMTMSVTNRFNRSNNY